MMKISKLQWVAVWLIFYIAPASLVAILAPQYVIAYANIAVSPSALTQFIIHGYSFTFALLFVGCLLTILAWFDKSADKLRLSIWFNGSIFVAGAYSLWLWLVWYGLRNPMAVMEAVVQ